MHVVFSITFVSAAATMQVAARSTSRVSGVQASRPSVARLSTVVVKASDAAAPPAAKKAAPKAPWVQPTLNEDTPSPIFGGSTGGLLRKAQVVG
jgi:hypothetical protein